MNGDGRQLNQVSEDGSVPDVQYLMVSRNPSARDMSLLHECALESVQTATNRYSVLPLIHPVQDNSNPLDLPGEGESKGAVAKRIANRFLLLQDNY